MASPISSRDQPSNGRLWALWAYRVELGLVAVPLVVRGAVAKLVGDGAATVIVVLMVGLLLAIGSTRHLISAHLHKARIRRRWARACHDAALVNVHGQAPRVCHLDRLQAGDRLTVQVPPGGTVSDLEHGAERLAASLSIREVRVTRDPADASRAKIDLIRHDLLGHADSLPWPVAHGSRIDVWEPIPVGLDESGQLISLSLPERNVLIGGEPGAGKSAALSLLVAAAALDPDCKLWLFDGKMVELAAWTANAERTVGIDADEAIDALQQLRREMEDRYRWLLAQGLRKVEQGDDLALHVVVFDELALYLTLPDRKQRQALTELLRDLISRGRSAGIIVLAATQKPSSEVIPTSIRDLFGFRWAMRCNTSQASDTILGSGWSSLGYDAARIPAGQRGVGYLLAEDGQPTRLRSFYLNDAAIEQLAERAETARRFVFTDSIR